MGSHTLVSALAIPRPLVLLVDDTESVLRLLRRSLARQEYDLLTASSASEALVTTAGSPRRLDLAVLDLDLADMDGEELAAKLRSRRPDLRVLYTSGCAEGSAHLPDPVLRKPFVPDELVRRIRAMLPYRRRSSRPSGEPLLGDDDRTAPAGTILSYRLRVRTEYRAAYPWVPEGWLPAHRRATDRGALWLDAEPGGSAVPTLPILEPHVELEAIAHRGPTLPSSDERTREGRG